MVYSPDNFTFGLLPEPEGRTRSFVASSVTNLAIFSIAIGIAMTARPVIQQHFEQTELLMPTLPPAIKPHKPHPAPAPKIKMPPPRVEPPKPLQMEAKMEPPTLPHTAPKVALARQPRAALAAAMPAQNNTIRPSTRPVHLGDTFGVVPNPTATRPATVAAIGNPYGGMEGPAVQPHGVVKSTGLGDGTRFGSGGGGNGTGGGRVVSVGMPGYAPAAASPVYSSAQVQTTSVEILSKPPVQYTSEARQSRIEGNVVLSVTFSSSGQVVVRGIVHGLGHGLDQEAVRVAQQIQFRPATSNGRPVDVTTHITIAFQLA